MVHPDDDWQPALDADRPTCCDRPMRPIVYGMPGPDLFDASSRGEVSLGGCVIRDGLPEWECPVCERTAGELQLGSELHRQRPW